MSALLDGFHEFQLKVQQHIKEEVKRKEREIESKWLVRQQAWQTQKSEMLRTIESLNRRLDSHQNAVLHFAAAQAQSRAMDHSSTNRVTESSDPSLKCHLCPAFASASVPVFRLNCERCGRLLNYHQACGEAARNFGRVQYNLEQKKLVACHLCVNPPIRAAPVPVRSVRVHPSKLPPNQSTQPVIRHGPSAPAKPLTVNQPPPLEAAESSEAITDRQTESERQSSFIDLRSSSEASRKRSASEAKETDVSSMSERAANVIDDGISSNRSDRSQTSRVGKDHQRKESEKRVNTNQSDSSIQVTKSSSQRKTRKPRRDSSSVSSELSLSSMSQSRSPKGVFTIQRKVDESAEVTPLPSSKRLSKKKRRRSTQLIDDSEDDDESSPVALRKRGRKRSSTQHSSTSATPTKDLWLSKNSERYGKLIEDEQCQKHGIQFRWKVGDGVIKRCPFSSSLIYCSVMARQAREYSFGGVNVLIKYCLVSSPGLGKTRRQFWDFVPESELLSAKPTLEDGSINRSAAAHWIFLMLMRDYFDTHEPDHEIMGVSGLKKDQVKHELRFWKEYNSLAMQMGEQFIQVPLHFHRYDDCTEPSRRKSVKIANMKVEKIVVEPGQTLSKSSPKERIARPLTAERLFGAVKKGILPEGLRVSNFEAYQCDWMNHLDRRGSAKSWATKAFQLGFEETTEDDRPGDSPTHWFDVVFARRWADVDLSDQHLTVHSEGEITPFFGYRRMVAKKVADGMDEMQIWDAVNKSVKQLIRSETNDDFLFQVAKMDLDLRYQAIQPSEGLKKIQREQHFYKRQFFDVEQWSRLSRENCSVITERTIIVAVLFGSELFDLYKRLVCQP